MSKSKQNDWAGYHDLTRGKPPSPLLIEALGYVSNKNRAIDIGAGALRDTIYLLDQGFRVTAIDNEPSIAQRVELLKNAKLTHFITSFGEFNFPNNTYDLASASFSLPFNPPQTFNRVFDGIKISLKKNGIFCGQFFGVKDEWNILGTNMTFQTKGQIEQLLVDLEIISLEEEEKNAPTAKGTMKHWHVFHVIARKK